MTNVLQQLRAANIARQREWDPEGKIDTMFRSTELGGETGEAQNCAKKLFRERIGLKGSRSSVEALAEELADVIIAADLLATEFGIDLWRAIIHKFNRSSVENGLQTMMMIDQPLSEADVRRAFTIFTQDATNPYSASAMRAVLQAFRS